MCYDTFMDIQQEQTIQEKLKILSDAAKYDVACTSSGVDRRAAKGAMGSCNASGICHAFAADGRCISLLKILMSNECEFDCKYCVNRRSNDTPRATFSPEEICHLTTEFYKRNYIEGLFLSSGIIGTPNKTMELLYETLYLLRKKYRFMGYIHVKGIPGASQDVIRKTGFLADRMSFNLELPTDESIKLLAPGKSEEKILGPMKYVQAGIHGNGYYGKSAYQTTRKILGMENDINALWDNAVPKGQLTDTSASTERKIWLPEKVEENDRNWLANGRLSSYVPAGQSTQMIIGATKETDYQILMKTENLYQDYDLKRVFFSAFINTTHDSLLPDTPDGPPLLREHRLYQADFLLRYYGFQAKELLSAQNPNFNPLVDPKCNWALKHLALFPVEVERAGYEMLLRVPGIGVKSAHRIVEARKTGRLSFDILKRLGVVLKRAHYFILCNGKQMYQTRIDEQYILREIVYMDREKNWQLSRKEDFRQMDLFTDQLLQEGAS